MAQDDYYYEIQLTNKQLVFYFMAGATGLILSFLAGVMVGRGVDTTGEVQAARNVQEDRVVSEEPLAGRSSPAPAEGFSYPKLDQEKPPETLEKEAPPPSVASRPLPTPKPARSAALAPPTTEALAPPPTSAAAAVPRPTPAPVKPAPKPSPAAAAPAAGNFTIQVGAFKEKPAADSIVSRLKKKGFAAYLVAPEGGDGLFSVRVGTFSSRPDAEKVQTRLRDEEKFKPYIVAQQQ